MKMLYVGCGHFLQSTDDCLMWAKLGIEWYDTSYYHSSNMGDCGPIEPYYGGIDFYEKLIRENRGNRQKTDEVLNQKDMQFAKMLPNNLWQFSKGFVDQFDVVFFNHLVENVSNNLHLLKNQKVVLKTFGMHPLTWEQQIKKVRQQGVYVVRNNPTEYLRCNILANSQVFIYNRQTGQTKLNFGKTDLYGGHDAIMRGCIIRDENEFGGWKGNKKEVVTFSNCFNYYDSNCQRRRKLYCEIRNGLPDYNFRLFGSCNDDEPLNEGFVTHSQKVDILRNARVALVVGTPGSAHTYSFIEALVMGIPIVVFNRNMWQSDIYDVDKIIEDGVNGFICEDCNDAKQKITMLMNDKKLAKQIGEAGRKTGVELYGRENRAKDWRQFLFEDIWQTKNSKIIKKINKDDICSFTSEKPKRGTSLVIGMGR